MRLQHFLATYFLPMACISFDFCFYFITMNQCRNPTLSPTISEYNASLFFPYTYTVLSICVFAVVLFFLKCFWYICVSSGYEYDPKTGTFEDPNSFIYLQYFHLGETVFLSLPIMGYGMNFLFQFGFNRSLKWQWITMMLFNSFNCIKLIQFARYVKFIDLKVKLEKIAYIASVVVFCFGLSLLLVSSGIRYNQATKHIFTARERCEIVSFVPTYYFQASTVRTLNPVTQMKVYEAPAFVPALSNEQRKNFYIVYNPDSSRFTNADLQNCSDTRRFSTFMEYKEMEFMLKKTDTKNIRTTLTDTSFLVEYPENFYEAFQSATCLVNQNSFPLVNNQTMLIQSRVVTKPLNQFCRFYQMVEYFHPCFRYECCEM
jgi:hypothetical protein